jgi:two-component system, chemotaxis family, response regulator Rcp1
MNQADPEHRTRIVVIEDNPADVELLRLALAEADFNCELNVIEDGAEALSFFREEALGSGAWRPDMVVLDLNLPKYDGLEILEAVRANGNFSDLPIAVLSSSSSPRERARLEAFGGVLHLAKPADLEKYLAIGPTLRDFYRAKRSDKSSHPEQP